MKRYSNEIAPIEFEMQDLKGNWKSFKVRQLNAVEMQKIHEMETAENQKPFDRMREEMAIFCGGKAEDYIKYDIRMLKQVINDIGVELRNPLPTAQE